MAYPFYNYYNNPYQPVGFNPYLQNIPQQNSQPIQQSSIVWVNGVQDAQMYPIAPNAAVALWEKTGKTIYLKQADATGKPTITIYDLVERVSTNEQSEATGVSYATKDDLVEVANIVSSVKTDIDAMKADLYGIAGKSKMTKKGVSENDE